MNVPLSYALVVELEAYEYWGEFYVLGDAYRTPGEVLRHVAAEHIRAIEECRRIEEYLLGVLSRGENASRSAYRAADPDVECHLHVETDYGRFRFETPDEQLELPAQPTRAAIENVADQLAS